jgi:hypothetical protein
MKYKFPKGYPYLAEYNTLTSLKVVFFAKDKCVVVKTTESLKRTWYLGRICELREYNFNKKEINWK